jgi:hypothetical protein
MPRPKPKNAKPPVTDYRHQAKRKHIPPAGLADECETGLHFTKLITALDQ